MNTTKLTLSIYWSQIKKFKISLILMAICIPLAALSIDIILPYILSLAIEKITSNSYQEVYNFIYIAIGVTILGILLNFIGFQAIVTHESNVRKNLINLTLEKLLMKDVSFFNNQKIGSLTGKFIDFINSHVALQDLLVIQIFRFILVFGSGIAIIMLNSMVLGLFVIGLLVILIVQVQISIKLRSKLRHQRKELISESNGAIADIITNNIIVKTFAQETFEKFNINLINEKYQKVYRKDFRWMSIEGSLRLFIMSLIQVAIIFIVIELLKSNQINIGLAIFIIAYLQRLSSQIFSLGEILNGLDKILLQAAPMTELLNKSPKILDNQNAKKLNVKNGKIEIKNINYMYSEDNINVFNDLNLSIFPGEKIGIVGKSGAGKSTLMKLLLRFDDVKRGDILIDGQSIYEVTQESLRKNIAYVPQDSQLFHRSILENIKYGKLDASFEEIKKAAKSAHALEFIEQLPDKFNSIVGERGIKLSGGQRQRIVIARAILKDAPILILDEATSALDSESEKNIQDALEILMKNRTSLVIAHRLSTISKMDRIIVLDNGEIKEVGSHNELINNGQIYANLWSHQSGGFIK